MIDLAVTATGYINLPITALAEGCIGPGAGQIGVFGRVPAAAIGDEIPEVAATNVGQQIMTVHGRVLVAPVNKTTDDRTVVAIMIVTEDGEGVVSLGATAVGIINGVGFITGPAVIFVAS